MFLILRYHSLYIFNISHIFPSIIPILHITIIISSTLYYHNHIYSHTQQNEKERERKGAKTYKILIILSLWLYHFAALIIYHIYFHRIENESQEKTKISNIKRTRDAYILYIHLYYSVAFDWIGVFFYF